MTERSSGKAASQRIGRPPKVAVDDILDAAIELFGSRGLKGTSIASVAVEMGMTDAGILHYFPTKGALVQAAVDRAVARQVGRMHEIIAPGGLAAIEGIGEWGAVNAEMPELTALQIILSSEAILPHSDVRAAVRRRYAAVHDLVAGLIREGIERGEIRAGVDADQEARALIAFLDGIRLQWFYSDLTLPIADEVRAYVQQLAARLRVPQP